MTKTILITGATAGFGEAAARKFAAGGWQVIGTGRRGDRLQALQEELGDAFLPLEIDMRDRDARRRPGAARRRRGARSTCCSTMPASRRRPTRCPTPTGSGSSR